MVIPGNAASFSQGWCGYEWYTIWFTPLHHARSACAFMANGCLSQRRVSPPLVKASAETTLPPPHTCATLPPKFELPFLSGSESVPAQNSAIVQSPHLAYFRSSHGALP